MMHPVTCGATPTFSNAHASIKVGIRLLTGMLFFMGIRLHAQPYLDLATVKYQHSPDAGVVRRGFRPSVFTYSTAGLNIPISFKDSSVLLFGPSLEQWNFNTAMAPGLPTTLNGLSFPVTFVKPLSTTWTATAIFINRWNGSSAFRTENNRQTGGAVLLTYQKRPTLKYKFGLYYNREFFGHFFVPLAGIDWTCNSRLRLFGVLPGNLVLERKVSRSFYYGASFRAFTASYRYGDLKNFIRVDDNQLQAFADLYLTKHLVLNAEAGHSLFRQRRAGTIPAGKNYQVREKYNDALLFRLAVAYRMRFD